MHAPGAGDGKILAVLGPTNTGKTHLAVERLCAHSSGMIGFPLRLLAREVYERVVAIKGGAQVALLTGEERIVPPDARYILATAEAMPVTTSMAFVAIDEAQLGADPERGHVFTDGLLRARGREETMILGSASATPMVRALVPDAEIIGRPRFSTLSYAGARKLSRLPRRSAIVAFSAEQVYAIAETLRRFAGGAAVVMGALSPRTRNAQVAMFQAGEVDYLVATDAIGMGLNLDVAHVAFAGFSKFDGRRQRRLTIAEMAQIAGRAGRHQQDGTFGSIGSEADGFTPEEILALEDHRVPPLGHLYWRDGSPDTSSLASLLAALDTVPVDPVLRAAPEAVDLAVLRRLADDPAVVAACTGPDLVARLWDVCGLPDFQKMGADHHARTVHRLWDYRSTGDGHVDPGWFAGQLDRLDRTEGDVETLSARIAMVRTWCYIANRGDWLVDAAGWAERTRAIEGKLSDALHDALTQRFVNRRTTVLLRDLKQTRASLPVTIAGDGAVSVDGEGIGTLEGFQFRVDPRARAADHRILLAAAERHLAREMAERATALAGAADDQLTLDPAGPAIRWRGVIVATLARGRTLLDPQLSLDGGVRRLDAPLAEAVRVRLEGWLAAQIARHLAPLAAMGTAAADPAMSADTRALLAALIERGGIAPRAEVAQLIDAIPRDARGPLRRLGLVPGTLDIFHPQLLKPQAVAWRAMLMALVRGVATPPLPAAGAVVIPAPARGGDADGRDRQRDNGGAAAWGALVAGFRPAGTRWLRIDLAERLAREAHAARQTVAPAIEQAPAIGQANAIEQAPVIHDAPAPAPAAEEVSDAIGSASAEPSDAPPAAPPDAPPGGDASLAVPEDASERSAADTDAAGPIPDGSAARGRGDAAAAPAPAPSRRPDSIVIDAALATSLGLTEADRVAFLATLGFRPLPATVADGEPAPPPRFRWISPQRLAQREARARNAAIARQRRAAAPRPAAAAGDDDGASRPRASSRPGPADGADRAARSARSDRPRGGKSDRPRTDAPRPAPAPAHSPFAALAALLPALHDQRGIGPSRKDARRKGPPR